MYSVDCPNLCYGLDHVHVLPYKYYLRIFSLINSLLSINGNIIHLVDISFLSMIWKRIHEVDFSQGKFTNNHKKSQSDPLTPYCSQKFFTLFFTNPGIYSYTNYKCKKKTHDTQFKLMTMQNILFKLISISLKVLQYDSFGGQILLFLSCNMFLVDFENALINVNGYTYIQSRKWAPLVSFFLYIKYILNITMTKICN